MKKIALTIAMLVMAGTAQAAKPAFTGQNYSGVYDCKGSNDKVGDYEVTISLKINRVSSYAKFGAYTYEVTTVNSTNYIGQAIANGSEMALSFPLKTGLNADHSIGIAKMLKNKQGHWSFRKYYYEEDNSGGNYGSEYCALNIHKAFKDQEKEPTAKAPAAKGKEQPGKEQSKEQQSKDQQPKDQQSKDQQSKEKEPAGKATGKDQPAKEQSQPKNADTPAAKP